MMVKVRVRLLTDFTPALKRSVGRSVRSLPYIPLYCLAMAVSLVDSTEPTRLEAVLDLMKERPGVSPR
jgi:hypothetical protein